jgi:hypothetical protein
MAVRVGRRSFMVMDDRRCRWSGELACSREECDVGEENKRASEGQEL